MRILAVTALLLMTSLYALAYEGEDAFNQSQADITVACGNYDISKLWAYPTLLPSVPNTIIVVQKKSWADEDPNMHVAAALRVGRDGKCAQVRLGGLERRINREVRNIEVFTESNESLFHCPNEIDQIRKQGLKITKPKMKRSENESEIRRAYIFPVVNSQGAKVKTLTVGMSFNKRIMDDNDWKTELCRLK